MMAVFLFNVLFFLLNLSKATEEKESCDSLATCLQDLSKYVDRCGTELKDVIMDIKIQEDNGSVCRNATDIFLKFVQLQSFRARQIGECIKTTTEIASATNCPEMIVGIDGKRRKKRDNKENLNKWIQSAEIVRRDCSNGNQIVNDVKKNLTSSNFLSRQQIVNYVKKHCDGNSTLAVENMPAIGGDPKLENSVNKILKECENGEDVVKAAKEKAMELEFPSSEALATFVHQQCKGKSTLRADELPDFDKPDSNKTDSKKWIAAALKVEKDCSNGEEIISVLKPKLQGGQILSRLQILDYVQAECKGSSTLVLDDMPVIGGNPKLEKAVNKVLRDCKNAVPLLKEVKEKLIKVELLSGNDIVEYINKHCDGTSTLTTDDVPEFNDPRIEKAVKITQKDCKNSQTIFASLKAKLVAKRIFSRQQIVNYIAKQCDGKSTLTVEDVPELYGESSTVFGKKIEAAILKIQRECSNSEDLMYNARQLHLNGTLNSAKEIENYINDNCNGKSTLEATDIPLSDCSEQSVKNKTNECLKLVKKCNVATYCNTCYELSPLHIALNQATLNLDNAKKKCEVDKQKSIIF